jgi:diguanylate cyclase (GGDEF)-like protein
VLIVVFSYGLIQFTPRQFTLSWLIYGAVTGLALWLIRDRFGYPGVANIDIALIWLFFFLAMREHTFFGAKFNRLRNQVAEKNEQLQLLLAKIEKLASHDSLTGALNRRCLIEKLEAELQRAARTGHTFCFAMIDLDYFKDVNDKYGHPTGDAVLKIVAQCVDQSLRTPDQFGRLGGEEFGIILPSTEPSQGMIAIERIRDAVAQYDWGTIAPELTITFSAGISANADGDTVDEISRRVDKALYQAKHQGRNCIVPVEVAVPAAPHAVMPQSDDTPDPPDIYPGF